MEKRGDWRYENLVYESAINNGLTTLINYLTTDIKVVEGAVPCPLNVGRGGDWGDEYLVRKLNLQHKHAYYIYFSKFLPNKLNLSKYGIYCFVQNVLHIIIHIE